MPQVVRHARYKNAMGKVIDKKSPQWQRKEEQDDVRSDTVIELTEKLIALITDPAGPVYPTGVQVAALVLATKTVTLSYRDATTEAAAQEMVRQAQELVNQYDVRNGDGKTIG